MSSSVVFKCLRIPQLLKGFTPLINNAVRGIHCSAGLWCSQQRQLLKQYDTQQAQQAEASLVYEQSSKAMKSYLEKVREHDRFMATKAVEFEVGKRHLANMMGEDPETFTQEDVNRAIAYLLPSGLHEPLARPQMLPPQEVFAKRKDAQFDITGRPLHCFFYTNRPQFYQALHDIMVHVRMLEKYEDLQMRQPAVVEIVDKLEFGGTEWISQEELQSRLLEKMDTGQYNKVILALERLSMHPYSYRIKDFIMGYRIELEEKSSTTEIPELMVAADGRRYMTAVGTRKSAKAVVKVTDSGGGHFNINGLSILYFRILQDREQVLLPLHVVGLLGQMDVVAEVTGGGTTGQAGAIRYALATALRSFVSAQDVEKLRLAGLLTLDCRRRERKKPGQKGARAKHTWKKR